MQLTTETVNGFRYQVAVNTVGQIALAETVQWTYQGRNHSVKAYLKSIGLSNTKYKKLFDAKQREILDSEPQLLQDIGATLKTYDISLLFVILQHCCGLADPNTSTWANGTTLEHLLSKLKKERNILSHSRRVVQLSDTELVNKLSRLKVLISLILKKACILTWKPKHVVNKMISQMERKLRDLLLKVREPFDSRDLNSFSQLQNEIEAFHNILLDKVREDSRRELHEHYPRVWGVYLAVWLLPHLKLSPRSAISKLTIKEVVLWGLPFENEPRTIAHEDLLQVRHRDGTLPEVLIISGDCGAGKTTLLKFMLETWVNNPSQIQGLQDVSHLLFFSLRSSTVNNWEDLLKSILVKTFHDSKLSVKSFADLFLNFSIVLLLDGYEEANENSKRLITDILNIKSNLRIVITTRSVCLKELTQVVQGKKQPLRVEIQGIQWEDCCSYVENTIDEIMKDRLCGAAIKTNIMRHLSNMKKENDKLNIRMTLKLVTARELLAPGKGSHDIYEDLTNLMMGKMEMRLARRYIEDSEDKIKEYYGFQKELALFSWKRREQTLLPETVEELKTRCKMLGLPHKEILPGFFISRTETRDFMDVQTWSFPHISFQEHWAASYISDQLLNWVKQIKDLEVPYENPLFTSYFKDPAEAERLLSEEGQKELMVDVLCKALGLLPSLDEELLKTLARAVTSALSFNDSQYLSERRGCIGACKFIKASGCKSSVVKIFAQSLKGHTSWKVHSRFLKEILALVCYAGPKRIVLLKDDLEMGHTEELKAALKELAFKNIDVVMESFSVFADT